MDRSESGDGELPRGGRGNRLDSWKEIAAYLRVSVRTAQRWERQEALPTHRHEHAALGSVFALRPEIDGWLRRRLRGSEHLPPGPADAASCAAPASSIAVLPFAAIGAGDEIDELADGITEELINRLAHGSGLRVVARTSVFQYKGRPGDVREIGARLAAGAVLEGSVRRLGEHVRVTAQLIGVADGYHLFSELFDRTGPDLLAIQEEIAREIVAAMERDRPVRAALGATAADGAGAGEGDGAAGGRGAGPGPADPEV